MYQQPKLTGMVAEVLEEVVHLFRTEIRLAKAELGEKFGRLANGGVLLAIGSVLLVATMFLLLQDIVSWLAYAGLPEQWGYLLVAIVIGVIGAVLTIKGAGVMKPDNFVPSRTIGDIKADIATVKEHVT